MDRNEVKEILSTQLETLGSLSGRIVPPKELCEIANATACLAEVLLQYDVQAPAACRIGRDGIQIGPSYMFLDAASDLAPAKIEETEDAKGSDPARSFPEAAARALYEWMHEQMCGPVHTEGTYGNEHDAMDEAAGFIGMLLREYCDKDNLDEEEGAT